MQTTQSNSAPVSALTYADLERAYNAIKNAAEVPVASEISMNLGEYLKFWKFRAQSNDPIYWSIPIRINPYQRGYRIRMSDGSLQTILVDSKRQRACNHKWQITEMAGTKQGLVCRMKCSLCKKKITTHAIDFAVKPPESLIKPLMKPILRDIQIKPGVFTLPIFTA
jgi:hypothetical protein